VELYLHSPNTPSRRGAQLKHRDNFTFTFNQTLNFIEIRGVVLEYESETNERT